MRTTHVGAELERVPAGQLRHVPDDLDLVLVLFERTVAAVGVEAGPEDEPAVAVPIDVPGRQARRERVVEIQPRDARIRRRRCPVVERQDVDVVAEEAEPEVCEECAGQRVSTP